MWTYEIKKRGDGIRLESVYEATAHGRFGHRTSLVIEEKWEDVEAAEAQDFLDEVERFGLGLYVIPPRVNGVVDADHIKEHTAPPPHSPDSSDVNDLLNDFLERDEVTRQRYRKAIGK